MAYSFLYYNGTMESEYLEIMDKRKNASRFSREKNPLEQALQFGSIVEIEDILCEQHQATLSPKNDWAKRCRQIINICLEKKLNVNVEETNYCALLHFVMKHLDEDFESVIKKCEKFDINACNYLHNNYETKSLLHFAIKVRKQNVVKVLIEFGAKVDVRDGNKQTPLFHAVQTKQTEIAEMLLKAGANVNAEDSNNMMPINYAFGERDDTSSNEKYKPSKLVTLLCSYGAELNFKNCGGGNTLVAACEIGNFKEIEFLIEHGANLFTCDDDYKSALEVAAVKYNYSLVDFLLCRGGNNYKYEWGLVIRHLSQTVDNIREAFYHNRDDSYEAISIDWNLDFIGDEVKKAAEMIEFLADNGAELNTLDDGNITPLMISVRYNALEITECLLELNAIIYDSEDYPIYDSFSRHINTEFHSDKITTWKLLTAFLALKNYDIESYSCSRYINFDSIFSIYEKCEEEVIKMRGKKIWADRKVSFFDFLNEGYKYLFEKRIQRVEKMKNCQNVFIRFLKEFFKRNLPSVVIHEVMSYLTAGDFRNFGRAFCITEKSPNGKYSI
ncbi:putative ankyrin repeat protein RF_0381 isoform X2 [Leptopilina heterotoma]|uniref:putative ankyrin repeat protein RF_0381 isoform X2 n=1 Tax=Leptopilina heterotoma TaxID=63436 RepID=UPI001CA88984|nr:putative ankyrin repeat protein RF_0381 isoform X2 [Leptopilina heterotoma]